MCVWGGGGRGRQGCRYCAHTECIWKGGKDKIFMLRVKREMTKIIKGNKKEKKSV